MTIIQRTLARPRPMPARSLPATARVRVLEVELGVARRERDAALAVKANEKTDDRRFEAASAAAMAARDRVERVRVELMRARTDERRAS